MSAGGQQALVELPPKITGSTQHVTLDFLSLLSTGATLSSATVTAAVWSGTDSNPSALVNGAATVSGTTATQSLAGGVAGTIYKLTWTATTSDSQTLVLVALLAVLGDVI